MFKSINNDGRYSGGQASAASSGHGVASSASSGQKNQDSSWISMLSVVSRPAWSFLLKYLLGRPKTPALSECVPGWVSEEVKQTFVDENVFFGQLNDIMPVTQLSAHQVTYLRCQPSNVSAAGQSTLNWLDSDSLREMGIENAEIDIKDRQNSHMRDFSTIRKIYSHVLSSADREMEFNHILCENNWPTEAAGYLLKRDSTGKNVWAGGSYENAESWLSNIFQGKEWRVTSDHCAQPACGTKATVAKTTGPFASCSSRASIPGECAGHSSNKEKATDNVNPHTSQPGPLQSSQVPSIPGHVDGAGLATSCSEVAVLTPDQDHGYFSLEEEPTIRWLSMLKVLSEEVWQKANLLNEGCALLMIKTEGESSECREEEESTTVTAKELVVAEEEMEDSDSDSGSEDEAGDTAQEGSSAGAVVPRIPLCENKAIAYIMGGSCSDDDGDDSQSDEFSEDDDGFDSEGSSDLSDSVDEDDDESSDSENDADSETERLWNSLQQSRDPYNPHNFTACLHTSVAVARAIPTASASNSHPDSSPVSSPNQASSPLSCSPASPPGLSSSPPRNQDIWDDSTSASEADEAESLHLWNSFYTLSDPYSPLNFQAPLRTREPPKAEPRARGHVKKGSPRSSWHEAATSPPQYRKEDAEERLDSGFSEFLACTVATTISTTSACVVVKKVRFCENLEEIWASDEEEDRRGPWEELARDRWRFQRRCQEVEQSIAHCLDPQHRSLVYRRLTVSCTQDSKR